ncbi:MAG: sulfatase-like hydrolase/transferase [Bryobacterales bacterium]|nr:sulfatase-like hydrolase/transferase [Bryobacterales bacterium]
MLHQISRRNFLQGLAVLTQAKPKRPNILFLFADDQRVDTIAAYGNRYTVTPNIDRLSAAGVNFRQNYVFGGNSGAVCMPSRAMLMSGRTWFRVDNQMSNAPLLPELLQKEGYETFGTGKWHNGQPSWLRCFQKGRTIMFGGMSDHTKVPVSDLEPDGKLSPTRMGEKFSSEMFADSAIGYLEKRDRGKPFFAYVAFTAPHDPRQPPPAHREAYYRKNLPMPANFKPQLGFDNGMMRGGRDENLAAWPRTEAVIRDQLAEYYGMVTHLDEQIGRILKTLESQGDLENTIIVYAADNGLAMGSHGLLGKQNVYEHSMRVPLIISGPGIPRNRRIDAFSYLYDIFPTLCDLTSTKVPPGVEGETLRPIWEGKRDRVRDTVFLPFIDIQRSIRDERWKLIAFPKIGHLQLYDLRNDPHENRNLIGEPGMEKHVARLRTRMLEWQKKVGDAAPIPEKDHAPEPVDLSGKARIPDQWQPDWIVDKYFGGVKYQAPK